MKKKACQLVLGAALLGGFGSKPLLLARDSWNESNPWSGYFDLQSPAPAAPGTRHFSVGSLVGFNLKASFAMSGSFTFNGQNPGATGTPRVNHEYDDGYVRVDVTDNDPDATFYWGYDNASQYNESLNRLYFHSANNYAASASGSTTADPQVGFDTTYGGHLFAAGPTLIGWELGFGFLPIKIEEILTSSVSVTRTIHWYDTSNLGSEFFGSGSSILGSYEGNATGPSSAKLSDLANDGGTDTVTGTLSGKRTLDVTLYNFRLGPTVHMELGQRWAFAVSAGAAMGFVTGDMQYSETLILTGSSPNNSGRFSDSKLVYGGYVAGKLLFHAVDNGDFFIGAQYMPLGSATLSGGGREAKLDMSGGIYVTAGINWPF